MTLLRELENLPGFIINRFNLNNKRYSDYLLLIENTERKLKELLDFVVNESVKKILLTLPKQNVWSSAKKTAHGVRYELEPSESITLKNITISEVL